MFLEKSFKGFISLQETPACLAGVSSQVPLWQNGSTIFLLKTILVGKNNTKVVSKASSRHCELQKKT